MHEIVHRSTEVLVLGGGIAGLQAAVAAGRAGTRVTIAHVAHGASPYVVGANVALGHEDPADNAAAYFDDVVRGGYGLNDRRLVRALVENAPEAVAELARLDVPFARRGGRFQQRHLSGNTYARSIYVSEGTGRAILDRLVGAAQLLRIERLAGWRTLALLLRANSVRGALLYSRQRDGLLAINAAAVVLATGGIGRLYADSTYPADVSGDSYALALEAGARLIDMEFVQFEPTVTVHPVACTGMEMPTAMLGDGAQLLNAAGDRFMLRYNPEHGERRLEKARLALCIQQEIDEGRGLADGAVIFDTTKVPLRKLEGYVAHCRRLRAAGLDPVREAPHVRPAAHSIMGGVQIDENGGTTVPGLYACGEAAGGIHGASRLAGNGGSEIIVFGRIAGRAAARAADRLEPASDGSAGTAWERVREVSRRPKDVRPSEIVEALRALMTRNCGLYRDAKSLGAALDEICAMRALWSDGTTADTLTDLAVNRSVHNMLLAAEVIVGAAIMRTESRGAHQRRDFPASDDLAWRRHIATALSSGRLARTTVEIM